MTENFRKQAFGFNKQDVIDYISELSAEKTKIETESAEEIERLSSENEKLSTQNTQLEEQNESLNQEVSALKAEVASAASQRSRLFEEINEVRRTMLDNEREFNIKNEQISKLRAENEEYAEKCKKYAKIAEDVGKTIMEAKQMAEKIVNDAKKEAEDIKAQTRNMANDALSQISNAKQDIENLKLNLSDITRICENRISTIELNMDSVSQSISALNGENCENPSQEEAHSDDSVFF